MSRLPKPEPNLPSSDVEEAYQFGGFRRRQQARRPDVDARGLAALATNVEEALETIRSGLAPLPGELAAAAIDIDEPFSGRLFDHAASITVPLSGHEKKYITHVIKGDPFIRPQQTTVNILHVDVGDGLIVTDKFSFTLRILQNTVKITARPNASLEYVVNKKPQDAPSIRPRWAEENRPKKQVKLRLSPDLIDKVDTASDQDGLTRNDWIEAAIERALKPS